MCSSPIAFLLLLLLMSINFVSCSDYNQHFELVREGLVQAHHWALNGPGPYWADCANLYADAELRVARLLDDAHNWCREDAVTWLGAASASHTACLDELRESGPSDEVRVHPTARNLTRIIKEALEVSWGRRNGSCGNYEAVGRLVSTERSEGVLVSAADFVVAQDGSGNYKTVNEAVKAVAGMGGNRPGRVVIYVKSGIYREKVEIGRELKNLMLVGDGMDKTVITGNRNVRDGSTTVNSATFGVSGDGFWARDITFENTAGPWKNQAVAARVSSDLSVFYRCGFRGYQDTLMVQSLRQFYRDCQISGTVDFIFGDAAAVFQNCDILLRKPMDHQFITVTAQGRENPNSNTGISILNSRIVAGEAFQGVQCFLGRPWKTYSRTVVMKTNIDGVIDRRGWKEWNGDFGVSTLYYAEYQNTGAAADTSGRVRWPGFHALTDYGEANTFTAAKFIGGDWWIPSTGVPFWAGL